MDPDPRHAAILARVRAIPEGWVATYGDCSPGAPRLTGAVLRATAEPGLRGTASSAPTARSRRASASARSSPPRASRSTPTAGSTSAWPGSRRAGPPVTAGCAPPATTLAGRCGASARSPSTPGPRGISLITREVVAGADGLDRVDTGLLHVHLLHTSASLTLNENASPDVRRDLDAWLDRIAPEGERYEHSLEGRDDMPAHLKASLLGASLTLPVADGRLRLGTWQGVYLCEHRDHGGPRSLVLTLHGE